MSSEEHTIFGKHPVRQLLENRPERVFKLCVAEGLKRDPALESILDLAGQHRIRVQTMPRHKLDAMIRSAGEGADHLNHQGVVAVAAPRPLESIAQLAARCQAMQPDSQGYPLVLLLDGVTDPRNFGAILRVADGAGVSGVVIAKRESAGFGPVVAKTASGAEETVPVTVVPNLSQALKTLKDSGFWVVGTAMSDKAVTYDRQDYAMPVVLVLGSEGKGISRLVKEHCDFLVTIPMLGSVSSLNVSVATGVLLYEIRRQQGRFTSAPPAR
ncbi:MAG: 23S rRNA (guanosine(2251)-2'-O)-methyltransferase RlmB [Candidatus Melainabacteria bacterium]